MTPRYAAANQDIRTLLRSLGIDEYHATLMIAHMFIAPATTDMDMTPVRLFVKALQTELKKLGAPVEASGEIDLPTAGAFEVICGHDWPSIPWFQIGQYVIHAGDRHLSFAPKKAPSAMGATVDLPTMPAFGTLGWLAVLGGAYYLFVHKH